MLILTLTGQGFYHANLAVLVSNLWYIYIYYIYDNHSASQKITLDYVAFSHQLYPGFLQVSHECFTWNKNLVGFIRVGIVWDGSCSGWELSGREFPGVGIVRSRSCPWWKLSRVGIVRGGRECCPVGVFRVRVDRWELSDYRGEHTVKYSSTKTYTSKSVLTILVNWQISICIKKKKLFALYLLKIYLEVCQFTRMAMISLNESFLKDIHIWVIWR